MKITQERDHLDARVPLGLLLVAVVIIVLSALLTVGVRPVVQRPPGAPERAPGPPRHDEPTVFGTQPAQAAALFARGGSFTQTRSRPVELTQYGWVERERGLIRIPIARAKEVYLQRLAGANQPVLHRLPEEPR